MPYRTQYPHIYTLSGDTIANRHRFSHMYSAHTIWTHKEQMVKSYGIHCLRTLLHANTYVFGGVDRMLFLWPMPFRLLRSVVARYTHTSHTIQTTRLPLYHFRLLKHRSNGLNASKIRSDGNTIESTERRNSFDMWSRSYGA